MIDVGGVIGEVGFMLLNVFVIFVIIFFVLVFGLSIIL